MGLFEPAWMSKDKNKAVKAVRMLTDEKVLTRVLQKAQHNEVITAALVRIAQVAQDWEVRQAAVKQMADQNFWADIAENDLHIYVCYASVQCLADQNILLEIAEKTEDWGVCKAAIEKLTNPIALVGLAINNRHVEMFTINAYSGIAAINRLYDMNDQRALTDVARKAKDAYIRMEAVKKLTDEDMAQEILVDIAKNGEYYFSLRMEALGKLIGKEYIEQDIYTDIAAKAKTHYFRGTDEIDAASDALKNLTNREVLLDVAKNANAETIRFEAEKRFKELKIFE